MKNLIAGFRDFIMRGNVVELAVAVVIGTAFTQLVKAFTDGFITPLIGAIFGGRTAFADWSWRVRGQTVNWGLIVNAVIVFLIIAAVIYFLVVAPMNAMNARRARPGRSRHHPPAVPVLRVRRPDRGDQVRLLHSELAPAA